jgi:hypothetical protein
MTYRAAKDIIAECDGPESFELKKPGQAVGHPYERYNIKRLKTDSSSESYPAPPLDATPKESHGGVFISYSHRDKAWLETLEVHLKPYLRTGLIRAWNDTLIRPGEPWRDEIRRALAEARVAVLLVSPHFLNSEFIVTNELPPLLEAAKISGLKILWVPLSASSYDETEIGHYQAALDPSRPLDSLNAAEQSHAFVSLCKKIKAAVATKPG